jgi:putative addiction module CopG family antidote
MDTITLPPELVRFAEQAVTSGRYRDVPEVVSAAVRLLQRAEAERSSLIQSLEQADAEGERDGFVTMEDVEREMDALIEAADRQGA